MDQEPIERNGWYEIIRLIVVVALYALAATTLRGCFINPH